MPSGLRTAYRKVHLWGTSPTSSCRARPRLSSSTPKLGRIATLVCYDLEFPEWVRMPALSGAEILAAPTNWPVSAPRSAATPIEVVKAQADAAVNGMVVVAADRCGTERGVEWVGGSCIVAADGSCWPVRPRLPNPRCSWRT